LTVESLEDRITPIIAILVGHPMPPLILDLAAANAPPVPLVQFHPSAPIFSGPMAAGESTTALTFAGHASATVSLSPSLPGASGSGQDNIIIENYKYRLTGVAHESVTPPTAAAPGAFSIKLDLSGTVEEHFRWRQRIGEGKVDAQYSIQDLISGTWMPSDGATTSIVIHGSVVTDTAIHQTEVIDQSGLMMGPQSWTIDAVTHTTGFCDGSVRFAEDMPLKYMTSTTLTDQIHAFMSPMQSSPPGPGAPGPTSYLIDAVFMGSDKSQGVAHGTGGGGGAGKFPVIHATDSMAGMLSESVTPSSGNPFGVKDALDASGLVREHVLPAVVLVAPTALAPSGLVHTTTPTFSWTAVNGADFYFLTIIDQTVPEVIHGDVFGTSFTPGPGTLIPGHTYVWFVQALDFGGDASDFSNTLEFSVAFGSG
jgi:hypothetical protein